MNMKTVWVTFRPSGDGLRAEVPGPGPGGNCDCCADLPARQECEKSCGCSSP